MAHCYTFISCDEASYPSLNNVCTETRWFGWEDGYVYLNSAPTQFYQLHYNGENTCKCQQFTTQELWTLTKEEQCPETGRVSYEVRNCETGRGNVFEVVGGITPLNEPCEECPDGYTYNPETNSCERITTQDATYNGQDITVIAGDISAAYGWGGANFYQDVTNLPKPIVENTSPNRLTDNSGTDLVVIGNAQGIWDNTNGTNGRLNEVGIWGNGVPTNQWVGFAYCFNAPATGIYNIGMAADNRCRFRINGELIVQMNQGGTTWSFNYWHVIQVELTAGLNIIEMEGWNDGSAASFGAEIYDASQAELLAMTTLLELEAVTLFSTRDLIGENFQLGSTIGYSCPDGWVLDYCSNNGTPVCTLIEREPWIDCIYPTIEVDQYPCECWDVIQELPQKEGQLVTIKEEHGDCRECQQSIGQCVYSERTIACSIRVILPDPPPPDRGFKDCCYSHLVLASLTSGKSEYNDFNGFYFKRQLAGDDCDFTLIELSTGNEYDLNDGTYGVFTDFGGYVDQPDLTTYILQWKNVLNLLGTGQYQVKKEMTVAGIPFTELSNTFTLEHFSNEIADKTVRMDTVMDGELVHLGVNFKGTGFTTSMRTKGYFGNRSPKYTQDNLVRRNYRVDQISMSQENEYQYQTGLIPVCITEEIYDFLLFGNEIFISDYNRANHDYKFLRFEVEFGGNKGGKYYVNERHHRVNLTFKDREKNKRKLNC